jgi:hypothetical protein
MFGHPKSNNEFIKAHKRRLFILECFQLIIGVIGLVLFKRGVLGGWAVLSLCTVVLVGVLFIKPAVISVI